MTTQEAFAELHERFDELTYELLEPFVACTAACVGIWVRWWADRGWH